MRVLLTGIDGYIGSLAAVHLQERGHEVVGVDTGYYREGWLFNDGRSYVPACISSDLRHLRETDFDGFDAVVHLAELSNDPLALVNPDLTFEINHRGSVALARHARAAGVRRFVYASSCSVYGAGSGEFKDEESETNPQTPYAECKVRVERDVGSMADEDFAPTFLRNATAYGASPRMRFDIVLNNLSGHAFTEQVIRMTSDGSPWRPLVHVLDICQAIGCTLEAPEEVVRGQVFNVGSTPENFRVREIAEIVARTFPDCELTLGSSDGDNRSYRVNFDKIRDRLPGFQCGWTAEKGASQLLDVFTRIGLTASTFEARPFTRLKQLKYLMSTQQVDDNLFWTRP